MKHIRPKEIAVTDDVVKVGEKRIWRGHGAARVMAVVDGWIMARRPHSIPFVVNKKDWVCCPFPPTPVGGE
jgi:hypothetical protein